MLEGTWTIERKTDKAILFVKESNPEMKVWVPKKVLMRNYAPEAITDSMHDIRLPEWFTIKYVASKKGAAKSHKKKLSGDDDEWTEERKRIRDAAIAAWARDAGKDKKDNEIK